MKELSIYIHIPFCVKKCDYCDFLSAPAKEETKNRYVDMLLCEMDKAAGDYAEYEVISVFLGGGTPSVLALEDTTRIMACLREKFNISRYAEITTEVNPKTADYEKLKAYLESGFNRLSIGLQSADDIELGTLGRIHDYGDFLEVFHAARKAGFSNINVDVMSALPGQSVESYKSTLRKVLALSPEHISAYSLIIEEGTPFYEWYGEEDALRKAGRELKNCEKQKERPHLPSEEEERLMYEITEQMLLKQGYQRYEISNYAKKGYECLHNMVYWTRKEYVGFGVGAASFVGGERFRNTDHLQTYLEGNFEKEERTVLNRSDCMEEFMFLGLRLINGVSGKEFLAQFGVSVEEIYGAVLKKMEKQGLLQKTGDRIALTHRGLDVANYVMSEFLL